MYIILKIFFSQHLLTLFLFQTLYTYPDNFRAFKALIAAKYSGADVKVDSSFQYGVTNKTDAYLSKFPLGKVGSWCDFENIV